VTQRTDERAGAAPARAAVFLDRDGTVIHDRGYLSDPAGVELLPGAAGAIARLNRAGIPVILITNQSGIGRGFFDEEAFRSTQARLAELLEERGARFDGAYHCPHAPDRSPACGCRKPAPGLFVHAARLHAIDLSRSVFIGDRARDVAPASRFGGTAILVGAAEAPPEEVPNTLMVPDLERAVDAVLGTSLD
jgi:D-glycero-D-manno-heptose 1,7-bisphosphate phosphatase